MREIIGSNIPYPPQRGTGQINALEASAIITHALGVTPDTITPIPTNSAGAAAGLFVTAKTSTNFTIECNNPQAVAMTFDYEAGKT